MDDRKKILDGKNITVGVCACGNLGAVEALLHRLLREGAELEIVMTPSATKLMSPLILQRITDKPVLFDQFELPRAFDKEHRRAKPDLLLIAPTSANTAAKAANGIADNLLTSRILSAECPVAFVLNCNPYMYGKPATQRNLETLKADGMYLIESREKPGRFPDTDQIIEALAEIIFAGKES